MIEYLIKFVSKEKYAVDLLNGNLFMHCARYYHMLEEKYGPGQGDLREASIIPGIAMYKNINLPVFCLYTVESEDILDEEVAIDKRIIQDFGCENGFLVLIEYKRFVEEIKHCRTNGYQLDAGPVVYGTPSKELIVKLFEPSEIGNLFIKHPYFKYQKEYRIVICCAIDEKWKECKIDGRKMKVLAVEDMTASYCIPGGLRSFASCYEISKLEISDDNVLVPIRRGMLLY